MSSRADFQLPDGAHSLTPGDLDADLDLDLALLSGSRVLVFRNMGGGRVGPPEEHHAIWPRETSTETGTRTWRWSTSTAPSGPS